VFARLKTYEPYLKAHEPYTRKLLSRFRLKQAQSSIFPTHMLSLQHKYSHTHTFFDSFWSRSRAVSLATSSLAYEGGKEREGRGNEREQARAREKEKERKQQ